MKYISILLFLVILAGCTSNPASEKELEGEIHAIVKNNMPIREAISHLEDAGFSCYDGNVTRGVTKGIFECTRNKGGFLYGCIHRVWFDYPSESGVVSNLRIHKPACASL